MKASDRRRRRGRSIFVAGLIGVILAPAVAPAHRASAEWFRRRRASADPTAPFLEAPCHSEPDGSPPVPAEAEVAP